MKMNTLSDEITISEFLVLQLLPCAGNGLIVRGISAEEGQLSFLAYGSHGGIKRPLPELDLYRTIQVILGAPRGDLRRAISIELKENFSDLVKDYSGYQLAAWIASFAVQNVMPHLRHPFFMNAMVTAFRRLASVPNHGNCPLEAIQTGVVLSFLFEEGWLANVMEDKATAGQLKAMLEMASGLEPPKITTDCWKKQLGWAMNLLLLNECRLPTENKF